MYNTNKCSISLCLLRLVFGLCTLVIPEEVYSETVSWDSTFVQNIRNVEARWLDERNLFLRFSVPQNVTLKSVQRLRLQPALRENGEEVISFPSLMFLTKAGKRYFERRQNFSTTHEDFSVHDMVIAQKRNVEAWYQYSDTIRIGGGYNPTGEVSIKCWMADCCDEWLVAESAVPVTTLPVTPSEVAEKRDSFIVENFEVFIHYPWDSDEIYPDYMNNAGQLNILSEHIGKVLEKVKSGSLERVIVRGYASPEGTFDYNRKLSKRRAEAFGDYMADYYPIDRDLIYTLGCGENWKGLYEMVANDNQVPFQEEVIELLRDSEQLPVSHKKKILEKMHQGISYHYLLEKIYPYLRKMTVTIYYRTLW